MTLSQPTPPIAMLHSVRGRPHEITTDWCISHETFLRLLDAVEDAGATTTHFADKTGKKNLSRPVIITFDDCAKHLLDFAVPELVRRGMTAAFYMPTAHLGGHNEWDAEKGAERMQLMNESDLKELVRMGMEVGSHSHRHIELKPLSGTQRLKEEVALSKKILEEIVGRPVYSFAYPYGSVPTDYKKVLADAGYRYAVGIYHPTSPPLALRRFGVYEKDDSLSMRKKLSRRYRWMRSVYDAVKRN